MNFVTKPRLLKHHIYKFVLREYELFELIHSDICEFDSVSTHNEKKYFITFINYCSNFSYAYLMKNKSKAIDIFNFFFLIN